MAGITFDEIRRELAGESSPVPQPRSKKPESTSVFDEIRRELEPQSNQVSGYNVVGRKSNDPIHYGTHAEVGVFDITATEAKRRGKSLDQIARELGDSGYIAAVRRKGQRGITNDHIHAADPSLAPKEAARLKAQSANGNNDIYGNATGWAQRLAEPTTVDAMAASVTTDIGKKLNKPVAQSRATEWAKQKQDSLEEFVTKYSPKMELVQEGTGNRALDLAGIKLSDNPQVDDPAVVLPLNGPDREQFLDGIAARMAKGEKFTIDSLPANERRYVEEQARAWESEPTTLDAITTGIAMAATGPAGAAIVKAIPAIGKASNAIKAVDTAVDTLKNPVVRNAARVGVGAAKGIGENALWSAPIAITDPQKFVDINTNPLNIGLGGGIGAIGAISKVAPGALRDYLEGRKVYKGIAENPATTQVPGRMTATGERAANSFVKRGSDADVIAEVVARHGGSSVDALGKAHESALDTMNAWARLDDVGKQEIATNAGKNVAEVEEKLLSTQQTYKRLLDDEIASANQQYHSDVFNEETTTANADKSRVLRSYIKSSVGKPLKPITRTFNRGGKTVTQMVRANTHSYDISEIAQDFGMSPEEFADWAGGVLGQVGPEYNINGRNLGEVYDTITAYELRLIDDAIKPNTKLTTTQTEIPVEASPTTYTEPYTVPEESLQMTVGSGNPDNLSMFGNNDIQTTQPGQLSPTIPIKQNPVDSGLFGGGKTLDQIEAEAADRIAGIVPEADVPTPALSIRHVDNSGQPLPPGQFTGKLNDEAMEAARQRGLAGKASKSLFQRVSEGLTSFKNRYTRTYENIPRGSAKYAETNEVLRRITHAPAIARDKALRVYLNDDIVGLDDNRLDLFNSMKLLQDLDDMGKRGESLPFGWSHDDVTKELNHISAKVALDPEVAKRVANASEKMNALSNALVQAYGDLGFDISNRFTRENYMSHMVMDMLDEDRLVGNSKTVHVNRSPGHLRKRTGSSRDIVTDYATAQYRVISNMLHDIDKAKQLKRLEPMDITKTLKQRAKEANFSNLVGGPEVVARIRQMESEIATLRNGPDAGESDIRKLIAGMAQELDSLDPTRPYKQKIAIGFSKLKKLDAISPEEEMGNELFKRLQAIMDNNEEGAPAAGMILKAIADRESMIKEQLGANYLQWRNGVDQRLIPDSHTGYQPIKGKHFFTVDTLPEKIGRQLSQGIISDLSGIKQEDLRKMLVPGGDLKEWIIPKEIADTLERMDVVPNSKAVQLWKWNALFNPKKVLGYIFRAGLGDMGSSVYGLGFEATKNFKKASKELWDYNRSTRAPRGELKEWIDRGGTVSGQTIQEVGNPDELRKVLQLTKGGKNVDWINPLKWPELYVKNISQVVTWREGLNRYANYLTLLEQMQTDLAKGGPGRPKNFWRSKPEEVMALSDLRDRAFKLANEGIGAYDQVSEGGRTLRARSVPFYSFVEINMGGSLQLLRNAINNQDVTTAIGRRLLGKAVGSAPKVGALALTMGVVPGLAQVWNSTKFPDEEKNLPKQIRDKPHLILGKNADGSTRWIGNFDLLTDALEWFGLDTLPRDIADYREGKRTATQIVGDNLKKPITKAFNSAIPLEKLLVETAAGYQTYPDPFKPKQIRDRGQYLADQLKLGSEYTQLMGKPSKGYLADATKGLVGTTSDPQTDAYYETLKARDQFLKDPRDAKSNALYDYKRAIGFGDKKAAAKYKALYFKYGGNAGGIIQSVRSSSPLSGMNATEKKAFLDSLNPEEKRKYELAVKHWQKLAAGIAADNPPKTTVLAPTK